MSGCRWQMKNVRCRLLRLRGKFGALCARSSALGSCARRRLLLDGSLHRCSPRASAVWRDTDPRSQGGAPTGGCLTLFRPVGVTPPTVGPKPSRKLPRTRLRRTAAPWNRLTSKQACRNLSSKLSRQGLRAIAASSKCSRLGAGQMPR